METGVAIGDTLGKYRVTEKIGAGGMGEVFAAVHEGLGREVAIKVLRAGSVENEQRLARFRQEAEVVSRIGHANIVAVYDFGTLAGGGSYYVMERIRGESLAARLRRQPPLSPVEINAIFGQICRALAATHKKGIIHRDLKPDNVLLQEQPSGAPHVKVVDFGVAKVRGPVMAGAARLTSAGMMLGTPAYMAPEQINASPTVDGRADVYALGAMLYQALTGEPPFAGDELAILLAHMREVVTPPSAKVPGIAPALDALVLRALAKEPDGRQADALTFAAELEAALGPSLPAHERRVLPPPPPPAPRRARWIIPAVALPLIAGTLFYYAHARRQTTVAIAAGPSSSAQKGAAILASALAGEALARRDALHAIGELGARRGLDTVVHALADDNPEVRRAAAEAAPAIGKRGDAALLSALVSAKEGSGASLALDIDVARARLGVTDAVADLRRALTSPEPASRLAAAVALAQLDRGSAAELRAALTQAPAARRALRWRAFAELYRMGDADFRRELGAALDGKDAVAKLDAAETLARNADPRGRRALVALAHGDNPAAQLEAEALLAEAGDPEARDRIIQRLHETDPVTRERAALALGRLVRADADPAALGALAALLDDGDRGVRLLAAAAFYALDGARP